MLGLLYRDRGELDKLTVTQSTKDQFLELV